MALAGVNGARSAPDPEVIDQRSQQLQHNDSGRLWLC